MRKQSRKQIIFLAIAVCSMILMTACGGNFQFAVVKDEGLSRFDYYRNIEYVAEKMKLQTEGVTVISFNAPKEASEMKFRIQDLNENGQWEEYGVGSIILEPEREIAPKLKGNFGWNFYGGIKAIHVEMGKDVLYTLNAPDLEIPSHNQAMQIYLSGNRSIELGEEIPVFITIYNNGEEENNFELDDYYSPEVFEGLDVVRVVTVEFAE